MKIKDEKNGSMECGDYEALRYYQSYGDSFSGWVIRNKYNRYDYSDILANKEEAKIVLMQFASGK